MKKIAVLILLISSLVLGSCMMARMNVSQHPDYNFSATNPATIRIYDQFVPVKKFIIIGQVVLEQNYLTDMKKSKIELLRKASLMGGNGIIISGTRIAYTRYNIATTRGVVNIRNYGYTAYVGYFSQTVYQQVNAPVRKYYYIYVIRWRENTDES